MASFVWTETEDLGGRYAGVEDIDRGGLEAWYELLERLGTSENPFDALSSFILRLQALPDRSQKRPRVFISHRQADADCAERIAWRASQEGLDYWLDVHDPLLRYSKAAPPMILAAIIEIALLNCTHVIAAHTPNSAGSKWIPYELGRAKSRAVYSHQAAGWFHSQTSPAAYGEYVQLAEICRSEKEVVRWLKIHAPVGLVRPAPYHGQGAPPPLP